MNEDNRNWLLNTFPTFRGRTIMGEVLQAYLRAEMLLKGADQINKRTCGCQYRALAEAVHTLYDKWLLDEQKIHRG